METLILAVVRGLGPGVQARQYIQTVVVHFKFKDSIVHSKSRQMAGAHSRASHWSSQFNYKVVIIMH